MKKLPKSSGQALLIILLIMAVALTIGLAVTSRTVTDVQISEQTEEAARAFSAAEAGIEEALVTADYGDFDPKELDEGVTYQTSKEALGTTPPYPYLMTDVKDNEVKTLWLSEYPDYSSPYLGNNFVIFWGDRDLGENPALEVTVYYKTGGEDKTLRYALDPLAASRDPANNFCGPDEDLGEDNCEGVASLDSGDFSVGNKYAECRAVLDLSAAAGNPLFARLRLVYAGSGQLIGVEPAAGINLPSQGVKITSVGSAGAATRKVEVIREHPAPPEIFDFLLYSDSELIK